MSCSTGLSYIGGNCPVNYDTGNFFVNIKRRNTCFNELVNQLENRFGSKKPAILLYISESYPYEFFWRQLFPSARNQECQRQGKLLRRELDLDGVKADA